MLFFKRCNLFLVVALLVFSFVLPCLAIDTLCPSGETCLENPLKDIETPQQFIGKIISTVLSVVGSLALLVFIYGGLLWMTAAGNPGNVTKGKDAMLWAALGLVVIFSSYTIIKFIFSGIGA